MLDDWVDACLTLASRKATFYTGARKIIRPVRLRFSDLNDDLAISDAGYTKSKLTLLRKLYLHDESRTVALQLWERRLAQGKYGSVGFTTYNHFIKSDPTKKSKRASVMGPCLQSVCLTLTDKGEPSVDVFYRTTEIFKKFPADLVFLRDTLLAGFALDQRCITTFHFANVTVHPMYAVTIFPHLINPIKTLEALRGEDKYFFDWVVKWSARYLCDEYHRGIAKFAQAMRVYKDARERIPEEVQRDLRKYLVKHHPGHRNDYKEDDDE